MADPSGRQTAGASWCDATLKWAKKGGFGFRLGVALNPAGASMQELRAAWREADKLGLDSIWLPDHFVPPSRPVTAGNFEGWTMLAAMAADTNNAAIGVLVSAVGFRNPDLLADMARTIDHVSGGRTILGLGAGWYEPDYREYQYEYPAVDIRLQQLDHALDRIKQRLTRLVPPPIGRLPIMIGGSGEQITLRLVARHAQMWNSTVPPDEFRRKNEVLDVWCERLGRDPAEIERTAIVGGVQRQRAAEYLNAGAQHLIFDLAPPFGLRGIKKLLVAAGVGGDSPEEHSSTWEGSNDQSR